MSILESFLAAANGMSQAQINKESGGKQFDKDGKPLVGRYPDGSMPAPAQRAYGVAQMQIGTARETAKLHGIAWDEQKFMNDAGYNRALGNHHMDDLRKRYGGDEAKAQGAFHSGTGNVDKAIARFGDNWVQGLGPNGRNYVAKIGGGGVAGSGTGGTPSVRPLSIPDILKEVGRKEITGNPNQPQVLDPNKAGPALREGYVETANRAGAADDVLNQTIAALQGPGGIQEQQVEALAGRNERMDNLLNESAMRTTETMQRMQPLFQQKRAVVDQRRKLDQMNPLERGIRSLFDGNYDRQHLAEVEQGIDAELQLNGDEYKAILSMQDTLLGIVQKSYEGQNALLNLEGEHLSQNLELAGKSLAAASTMWDVTIKGLNVDQGQRAAQIQLSDQVLSQMTPGQMETAHNQAKASPDGTVTINGATFTEGTLLEARQRTGQQQLQLDQLRVNSELQNVALIEKSQDDLIGNMTTSQIRNAIQNGGEYNGVKLPLAKLNQGLQASVQGDELRVGLSGMDNARRNLQDMARSIGQSTQISGYRIAQLTGTQSKELNNLVMQQSAEFGQIQQQVRAANATGDGDRMATQFMPRLREMAAQRQQLIDGIATQWAGGNKDLKPLASAFLSGAPLNGESSARGLIAMVRGGQNFANASPQAKAAIDAARALVAQADAAPQTTPGQSVEALFGKAPNAKEKESQLLRDVVKKIGDVYSSTQFDTTIRAAPQIAKQFGHIGQNLNPETLSDAITVGDEQGYNRVAGDLGITAADAKTLFAGGAGSDKIWAKANKQGLSLEQWGSRLTTQQQMATTQYMDQHHPKVGQWSAGTVLANLLGHPRFADIAGQQAAGAAQSTFGDFVVGTAGSANQAANVAQYGKQMRDAYTLHRQSARTNQLNNLNSYGADADRRFYTILHALPGVNSPEAGRMWAEVQKIVKNPEWREQNTSSLDVIANAARNPSDFVFSGAAATVNNLQYEEYKLALGQAKFNDPNLERARRLALSKWGEYERVSDDAISALNTFRPEN